MSEQHYMQLALELAAGAVGRTSPNPPVGAVVVRDGQIVGRGYHPAAGKPHAEIYALRDAGAAAGNADLYVTLEPCAHQGRTGPCTEAIISAGIARVWVGTLDPNPQVSGRGVKQLEAAGITVTTGVLEADCRQLIAPFAKQITSGLPFVTLKMAMTLDGQTATSTGDSQWISNEQSRLHVQQMRDHADAIMVGVGTVLADNPQLTARIPDGKDPIRVVIDSTLSIPETARVFNPASSAGVIVVTTGQADSGKLKAIEKAGAEIITVPDKDGRVDLQKAMQELGARNIQSILLEGGATLAADALASGVVDRAAVFIAPKLLGGNDGKAVLTGAGCTRLNEALRLQDIRVRRFADDILIEGEIS